MAQKATEVFQHAGDDASYTRALFHPARPALATGDGAAGGGTVTVWRGFEEGAAPAQSKQTAHAGAVTALAWAAGDAVASGDDAGELVIGGRRVTPFGGEAVHSVLIAAGRGAGGGALVVAGNKQNTCLKLFGEDLGACLHEVAFRARRPARLSERP